MIQQIIRFLFTIFLPFIFVGGAKINPTSAIVGNQAGQFQSIQAAVDSGAWHVTVTPGEYDSFSVSHRVTIEMQQARIHNDGNELSIWIDVLAEGTVIQGNWEIYGDNTGVVLGDNFHGTGIYNNAPHVTLEGLKCTNLTAFCYIAPVATAHHTKIRDCEIRNVATSPTPQLLAGTGILFINGSSFNEVTGCYIEGQSQAIGTWYGASHNRIHGNRLTNNYGWIGVNSPRSAIEDYGVPGAVNTGNVIENNEIFGSNASGTELADELRGVIVRNNRIGNVGAAFWMGGTGSNKSLNATIEGNTFYGDGDDETNWFSGTGDIRDNTWRNWTNSNVGTIHLPSDALGDVTIEGNTFNGGGMVLRSSASVGILRFVGNEIDGASNPSVGILYFADTPAAAAVIADNTFTNINGRAINQNAGTALTVRNNIIYGAVWVGPNSLVEDNDFYTPFDIWTPLYIQSGVIARNNRIYADNTPMVVDGTATGAMVIDNFVARLDGTAAALPNCGANTCRDNWTVP